MDAVKKDILEQVYDEVPYVSEPFPDTAPEHLSSVARLFGLEFEPTTACRVLELGSAAGGNLIPHAQRNPKSHYVGVDLSGVQVKEGQAKIQALGLSNIELRQMSIADITPELGKFDYIICHGVFSWVPTDVRTAILRVCRENLSPKGLAIISYNTYPGWKFKEVLRDAMLFRGSKFDKPQQKVANARGMINFMQEMTFPGSLLRHLMDEQVADLRAAQNFYVLHEYLEPFNSPSYFKDFAAEAAAQGLTYVGDTEVHTMFASNLGDKVAGPIHNEANGDQIVLEQYMDFLKNRQFRQSILTHQERKGVVNYRLSLDRIREFNFCGFYRSKEASVELDYLPHTFYTMRNSHFSVSQPIEKAALLELNENHPSTLNFRQILEGAQKRLGSKLPTHGEVIARLLEQLIVRGFVKYRLQAVVAGHQISDTPKVTEQARADFSADPSRGTTNVWHEKVLFDVVEQHLLPVLDGTRTREQLVAHVFSQAKLGALQFNRDGKPVLDDAGIQSCAEEHTDNSLRALKAKGLLATA